MKTNLSSIEPLEARIAPALASLHIVNPTTATYTDLDGDKVTVKVSTGTLDDTLFTGVAQGLGDQLQLLDLSDPGFANASVTFTVVKAAAGDGLVAVGRIDGSGHSLGKVTVKGDLGDIDTDSLTALTARTMGRYDIATQGATASLESDITGNLGALTLTGDLTGVHLKVGGTIKTISIGGSVSGGQNGGADAGQISGGGSIGTVKITGNLSGSALGVNSGSIRSGGGITSVTIGGSVLGAQADGSGAIVSAGNIGTLKIAHDLWGAAGEGSGSILCGGVLGSATIGGSVIGGTPDGVGSASSSGLISASDSLGTLVITHDLKGGGGVDSGSVEVGGGVKSITVKGSVIGGMGSHAGSIESYAGLVGAVKIAHDIFGGSGMDAGSISLSGNVTSVSVSGSLFGGTADRTGNIFSTGDIGTLSIGHDLRGGSITTGTLTKSGYIGANHIGSVTIGGSVLAGTNDGDSTAHLDDNASIQAALDIGSITVKGVVVGTVGDGSQVTKVRFTAQGQDSPTATADLAIGKVTVGGRMELAQILAGYDPDLTPANGNAQIGAVSIKGDWIASDLVAGVRDVNGDGFGNADDARIAAGTSIAKIASITIGGVVVGTSQNLSDRFGFESVAIGSLKINGSLTPIFSPATLSPLTGGDVFVRLV